MVDPSRVRVSGPLEPFAAGFSAELKRQGYTSSSRSHQLHLMAHLSRWLAATALDLRVLSSIESERFLADRRAAGYSCRLSEQALRPLLDYLRGVDAIPPASTPVPEGPIEELLCRYRSYLASERGLVPAVARRYAQVVRPFLEDRLVSGGLDLEHLSIAEVAAFCVSRCRCLSPSTAKNTVTALRSFLGFLHAEGEIHESLVDAVPSVACWQATALPKGLQTEQVHSLLASCDGSTAHGLRDLAILTTLVRLGLRAGEVARLALEDIDWRAGEIIVRGKGNRDERLPLPTDVGEAIVAYLCRGRPRTAEGQAVFVRVPAPHRALTAGAVGDVVACAARRAGLPRIGAHRLRHTVATETLRAGASLTEVGQLLRHRRAATTAIYAKVDRQRLRTIARPWPGGAR